MKSGIHARKNWNTRATRTRTSTRTIRNTRNDYGNNRLHNRIRGCVFVIFAQDFIVYQGI